MRRSTTVLEDSPSPSSRGRSLSSQFDILMPSVSSEFVEFELSNNPAPVLQPGMRMSSRIPSRILNHYKVSHNTGSTSSYASSTGSSMKNQLPIRVVRPVRLTDEKFAHELFGRRPIQSNYSCVNKVAERQVPFPRSNRARKCVGGPAGYYGNTAQRVLPRPWMRANQSASSISSQAAGIHSSQSQPYLHTAIRQSEVSNPGSFRYKSRCHPQFVSSVVSNSTLSSIGCGRHFSNRTLQFDASRTTWFDTRERHRVHRRTLQFSADQVCQT